MSQNQKSKIRTVISSPFKAKRIVILGIAILLLIPVAGAFAQSLLGQVGTEISTSDPILLNGVAYEVGYPTTNGPNPYLEAKNFISCTQVSSTSWICPSVTIPLGDLYTIAGWITSEGNTNPQLNFTSLANSTSLYYYSLVQGCPSSCTQQGNFSSVGYALDNGEQEQFAAVLNVTGWDHNQSVTLEIGA